MNDLKMVLNESGVLPWLSELFPDESEADLVRRIDADFEGVLLELETKREGLRGVESREAVSNENSRGALI